MTEGERYEGWTQRLLDEGMSFEFVSEPIEERVTDRFSEEIFGGRFLEAAFWLRDPACLALHEALISSVRRARTETDRVEAIKRARLSADEACRDLALRKADLLSLISGAAEREVEVRGRQRLDPKARYDRRSCLWSRRVDWRPVPVIDTSGTVTKDGSFYQSAGFRPTYR